MPFFSVVVPLYNKEKYIEATISSALQQTFEDFEIIIVDDGSTDESYQKVLAFKDPRIIILRQENKGVSEARNSGIKRAKSQYLALLDADDLWRPNHLNELYKSIQQYPEADLYCNNYDINYNSKIIRPASHSFNYENTPFLIENFFTSSMSHPVTYPSGSCIKKETLLKLGLFNPLYDSAEDLGIWIQLGLHYKIVFNPVITYTYSNHIWDSLSKSNYNINQYHLFLSTKAAEMKNHDLKVLIDSKRYGLALRSKINRDFGLYSKIVSDINSDNLTLKQKTLLSLPYFLLYPLDQLRTLLLNNSLYLRVFK